MLDDWKDQSSNLEDKQKKAALTRLFSPLKPSLIESLNDVMDGDGHVMDA